jgi:hypothetical protein
MKLANDIIEEIKSKNRIGPAIELLRALAKELNECADEWERLSKWGVHFREGGMVQRCVKEPPSE